MSLLGFLSGFLNILSKILTFFSNRALKQEGAREEVEKETSLTVTIQTKIAEQEAREDKSKEALIASAEKGEF